MVTLRTKRLVLRPYVAADTEDLHAWLQEPTIHRFTTNIPWPYTRAVARKWVRENGTAAHRKKKWTRRAFAIDYNGKLVGNIGLHNPQERRVSYGYWMAKPFRGRGFATEAARAIIAYAFRIGFSRVDGTVMLSNPASCRVMEKAGLKREGILRKYHHKEGKAIDVSLYAKVR